jgi:hypothetical protein
MRPVAWSRWPRAARCACGDQFLDIERVALGALHKVRLALVEACWASWPEDVRHDVVGRSGAIMMQFIVQHRLAFVIVVAAAVMLLVGGDQLQVRRRVTAGLLAVSLSCAVVSLGIVVNLTQFWWIPPGDVADHTVKVPGFLSSLQPLADQVKRVDSVENSWTAGVIALKVLAHYLAAALVAYVLASFMALWRFVDFVHDLRAMRAEYRARQW